MAENKIEVVINAKDYASKSLDNIKKNFTGIEKGAEKSTKKIDNMGSSLSGLIKTAGGLFALDKLKDLSDTFGNMQNKLRQITTEDNLGNMQRQMLQMANSSRVPVEDLTTSFVRFDMTMKQLGGTQQETAVIIDSLSKGLSLSGATATEAGSAMLQLSQAFGSGVLQGDEFRSLAENMPMLLDILAKKMGVTRGELKQLGADGKITSNILRSALVDANKEIVESFNKSQMTIGQKMIQIKNDILINFGEIDKKYHLTETFLNSIDIIGNAFKILGKDILNIFINLYNIIDNVFTGITGNLGDNSKKQITILERVSLGVSFLGAGFGLLADIITEVVKVGINVLKDLWSNIKILGSNTITLFGTLGMNIGKAFGNIPYYAKTGLNSFLSLIEKTINKAIDLLNKIPNVNIGKVIIGKLDTGQVTGFEKINVGLQELPGFANTARSSIVGLSNIVTNNENRFKSLADSIDNIGKSTKAVSKDFKSLDLLKLDGGAGKDKKLKKAKGGGGKSEEEKEIEKLKKISEETSQVFTKLQEGIAGSNTKVKEGKEELKKMGLEFIELQKKGKESLKDIANKYIELRDKQKEKIDQMKTSFEELKQKGLDSVNSLLQKWSELKSGLDNIGKKGVEDLANRVIDIENRQKAITTELQKQGIAEEEKNKLLLEQTKLSKELELAKGNVKAEDIDKVRAENEKSTTQKILDRVQQEKTAQELKIELVRQEIIEQEKLNKIQQEKAQAKITAEQLQNTTELNNLRNKAIEQKAINNKEQAEFLVKMNKKKTEIQKEHDLYLSLVESKFSIDSLYFDNFNVRIKEQMSETQKAINLLETLKNKGGTSTSALNINNSNSSNTGTELFNKKADIGANNSSNVSVNVNMGGVVANNNADINTIGDTIANKIMRQIQLQKIGIS